jgi:hypothetical protein
LNAGQLGIPEMRKTKITQPLSTNTRLPLTAARTSKVGWFHHGEAKTKSSKAIEKRGKDVY